MHDPNTIAYIVDAQIYTTTRGHVSVAIEEDRAGETTFEESAGGPHEVAFGVDAERFFALLLQAIRTGTSASGS